MSLAITGELNGLRASGRSVGEVQRSRPGPGRAWLEDYADSA